MVRNNLAFVIPAGLILGGLALGGPALAQEKQEMKEQSKSVQESMPEKMAQQQMPPMGPPEEMKQLASMEGVYDVAFKYRMDPTQAWMTTNGLATIKNILDGAAQEMVWQGDVMGMNFKGRGLVCYDRETQKWQTTWIDNMAGRISYYTGTMTDGKMVMEGEDVMEGQKVLARNTTYNMTDHGFESKMEYSHDGGKTYTTWATEVYTKR